MVKKKKMLTVEDLYKFCLETNFAKFSAKESGYQLAVQVPTTFEIDDTSDDNHRGMMRLKFRILHDGKNRNGSYVSHNAAVKASNTIADRPIMAAIHQLDDGSWDFKSHEMEIIKNDEGKPEINYIEKQVGSFSSEKPFWEHDDELDKDYLCAYGYVAEEYTKAADIIREKGWTKNSCELVIEEMAFNAKEKQLELNSFYLSASTLLGCEDDGTPIGEGMLGSRADIADFSVENNSVFSQNKQVIELLSDIKSKLDNLNINEIYGKEEHEPMKKKFEEDSEVAEAEVKETPSATFDGEPGEENPEDDPNYYEEEGSGDGEGGNDNDPPADDPTDPPADDPVDPPVDDPVDPPVDPPADDDDEPETIPLGQKDDDDTAGSAKKSVNSIEYAVTIDGIKKEYSVTLRDKLMALTTLINDNYGEMDGCYYDCDVDEDNKTVIMHDYWNNKHYRQLYSVKKGVYSLKGDRTEIFVQYLSQDEIDALEQMKANYSSIQDRLSQYESEPDKIKLIQSKDYAQIVNTDAYQHLAKRETYFSMSIDEVRDALDNMLLDFAKHNKIEFAVKETPKESYGVKQFGTALKSTSKSTGKGRYGGTFLK